MSNYRLGSVEFNINALEAPSSKLKALLYAAHTNKERPTCLCKGKNGEPVVLAHHNGKWIIRRFSGKGHRHDRRCDHFSPDAVEHGRKIYTDLAIKNLDGGGAAYRLSIPLQSREEAWDTYRNAASEGDATRNSIGLQGILHDLWLRAELNYWKAAYWRKVAENGGGRTIAWKDCARRLQEIVNASKIGQYTELADVLYVVPHYSPRHKEQIERQRTRFLNHVLEAPKGMPQNRGLVLGTIKQIERMDNKSALIHLHSMPMPIFMRWNHVEKMEQQHRLGWSIASALNPENGNKGAHVVGLFRVACRKTEQGRFRPYADSAVLMPTSEHFIPIHSGYEQTVAQKLVDAQRTFSKPLRYESGTTEVFPDFILHDAGEDVPMEIYGMTGVPVFDAKKAEKREWYRKTGSQFWEWEPNCRPEFPPFPASIWQKKDPLHD